MNRGYVPAKTATGAEELFLLIALIVLASTAGSVPGRRILDDPLTPIANGKARQHGASRRVVVGITAKGAFRVGRTGWFEFHKASDTIAAGERATERTIESIDEAISILAPQASAVARAGGSTAD